MTTPFTSRAEAGLVAARAISYNTEFQYATGHWGGPSPWGGTIRTAADADPNRSRTIWRGWQAFHMNTRGWSDIAYTAGICPSGMRYEGRPIRARTAANGTNTGNYRSSAIVYIAGVGDTLTNEAKHAFLDEAARQRLPLNRSHSDWKSTACPGDPVRDWIRAGAPRPGGTPPPPPPAAPDVDWAALRRFAAGSLRGPIGDQPTITARSQALRIVLLQQALNLVTNAGLVVDGRWGPATDKAVRDFQRFFGLTVDGIFGAQSRFVMAVVLDRIAAGEA